ncbi:MAG: hypothetical protein QOD75_4029 [Blastocatellia bacterium]|jgi:hypothetical protein|nr:hypothetical protein [Blastocatellia bacterium]
MTEAGDNKLLGNYRQLIDLVSADTNYTPANRTITKTALAAHHAAAQAAVAEIATRSAPNKLAISERQAAYDELPDLVRRSRNMLKASGASKEIMDDAETHVRKLTGGRKSTKTKHDPNTPEAEAAKQHSASQMSYDNQLGNFNAYVAVLNNVPAYAPNEDELKLPSLQATADNLRAKNDAVSASFVPFSQARGARDQILYTDEDSVVNRSLLTKAYVSAAFGSQSKLFKQIKGLTFKSPPK